MATELEKLKAAFPKASTSVKKFLRETLGEEVFEGKITDRVKTFEDACKILGITQTVSMIIAPKSIDKYRKHQEAHLKLMIISDALNEGWKPDWNNSNEYKYYPWFDMRSKAGFGFSSANFDRTITLSCVGSRLCFKTEELATYAGKQFLSLYKDLLTL